MNILLSTKKDKNGLQKDILINNDTNKISYWITKNDRVIRYGIPNITPDKLNIILSKKQIDKIISETIF